MKSNKQKPVEEIIADYHKKVRDFVEAKLLETVGDIKRNYTPTNEQILKELD